MAAKVEVRGGIGVRSNTRGPEDPIRSWPMTIQVHEVESSINCGLRAQWGAVDVDGEELEICSGAGFGSAWATISFRGKEYAIGAHEIVEAFLDAINEEPPVKWYVPCGCDSHGDHLGCDKSCEDYGCQHPVGKEVTAATEEEADSHVHGPKCWGEKEEA